LDLKQEFINISNELNENSKTFEEFYLNAPIDEIPENVFIDVKFGKIKMYSNFTRIHSNAFNSTSPITDDFYHWTFYPKLRNCPPDYDFYEAFSSLVKLEELYISLDSDTVHEIPDYAFNRLINELIYFKNINIYASLFSRIGDYAFYNLPSLVFIGFGSNLIENISAHAFDFQLSSDSNLGIDLSGAQLDEECLEIGVFQSSLRKIHLDLSIELFSRLFKNLIDLKTFYKKLKTLFNI
jgi:hypothetical protein